MKSSVSQKSEGLTLDQQQGLYHLLQGSENLFITGGAGTGKSYVIRHYLGKAGLGKSVSVLASTGAAAILMGGRTFHSYFSLGIMNGGIQATFERTLKDRRLKKRLREASLLIIDEVSMLSFEALDCAELIARTLRDNQKPWGGLRIIAVGDFAQLPPVSTTSQKPWAFLGEAWANSSFRTIVLRESMRSEDPEFLKILQDVRVGELSHRVSAFLENQTQSAAQERIENFETTFLFPRRYQTDEFNMAKLAEIPGNTRSFETIYSGAAHHVEKLKRDAPVSEILTLKKGARVMLRVNDPKQRFVNGTCGEITDFKDGKIRINITTREIDLEPMTFSILDDDGFEVASARNFPVGLAYASTIHKIQGATLDRIHVDLKSLWEPGQAYVALSRVRRSQDVTISGWSKGSIRTDPLVNQFYASIPR